MYIYILCMPRAFILELPKPKLQLMNSAKPYRNKELNRKLRSLKIQGSLLLAGRGNDFEVVSWCKIRAQFISDELKKCQPRYIYFVHQQSHNIEFVIQLDHVLEFPVILFTYLLHYPSTCRYIH